MNILKHTTPLLSSQSFYIEPTIIVVNEFTEASLATFRTQMSVAQNSGQTEIPIVIDSYGGSCYSLLGMIDLIEQSHVPVITVVESKAMSAGAVLFSIGVRRYMGPRARLLIHEVSSWAEGKVDDIETKARESRYLNEQLFAILDKQCKKSGDYFKNLIHAANHSDLILNADEAIHHGLAHFKYIPNFNIYINVKFEIR